MNIKDLREHVRGIISERIYSNGGLTPDYEAIYNDFMQSVEKQGGIKSDNVRPLSELEGTAFVFGKNYEFEFDYEVYNRQFVKARHGDNYNEPEYEELGGDFDFAITNAKVMDKEGDFVCDFDEIAERIDGGYDAVKEWFVFDESEMIENSPDLMSEAHRSAANNGSYSTIHETSRRQKAMSAIKGTSNRIKTCAILTSENPMTTLPKDYNDRLRQKLEVYLKTGNFAWFPVKGKYGDKENSYIIYNISLDDALHVGEKFEQESIIWVDNRGDEPVYQYWEQNGNGEFVKKHERNTYIDMTDQDDLWTQISRKFKFQIPFFDGTDAEVLKEHNTIIEKCLQSKINRGIVDEKYIAEAVKANLTKTKCGRRLWEMRGNLYGGIDKFWRKESEQ